MTVVSEEGCTIAYVSAAEAHSRVKKNIAIWDGVALGFNYETSAIRMLPALMVSRGFLDAWQKRPSGNYLEKEISQSLPRGSRGMRGEMVMQLV